MNHLLRAELAVALAALLGGCNSPIATEPAARPLLLGTWAEIVNPDSANPVDGRQVIERFANGTFKLVFMKTYPARPPCTGTWSVAASTYSMVFRSVNCFSEGSSKPIVGAELKVELVESSVSRLRFIVPGSIPLAAWQAKLEGGID